MQNISPGEVTKIIFLCTLFLLFISCFIILFVVIHQRQSIKYIKEKEEMINSYQQEILKAKLEMKEQTLHTISTDIHDGIGQILSLVKLNLSTLKLEENSPASLKIDDTKELVCRAIHDLRNLSKTLNSDFLIQQKLPEFIQFELEQIQKTGLYTATIEVLGDERAFDPQKQLIIFRIIQENFNNIIKHSKAKKISVVLKYTQEFLSIKIEDDGMGFKTATLNTQGIKEKGTGIGNMYLRAKLIGADFSIESELNNGTITKLSLPI